MSGNVFANLLEEILEGKHGYNRESTTYKGDWSNKTMGGDYEGEYWVTFHIERKQKIHLISGDSNPRREKPPPYENLIFINKNEIQMDYRCFENKKICLNKIKTDDDWESFSGISYKEMDGKMEEFGIITGKVHNRGDNTDNIINMFLENTSEEELKSFNITNKSTIEERLGASVFVNKKKEEETLSNLYMTYISLKTCYDFSKGKLEKYIQKTQMDEVKSYTKKFETKLFEELPRLKSLKDKIWNETSIKTTKQMRILKTIDYSKGKKMCDDIRSTFIMMAEQLFPPTEEVVEKDF